MRKTARLTESQWIDEQDLADIPRREGVAFTGQWHEATPWCGIDITICWLDDSQTWECEARYAESGSPQWSVTVTMEHARALDAAHLASEAVHAAVEMIRTRVTR